MFVLTLETDWYYENSTTSIIAVGEDTNKLKEMAQQRPEFSGKLVWEESDNCATCTVKEVPEYLTISYVIRPVMVV